MLNSASISTFRKENPWFLYVEVHTGILLIAWAVWTVLYFLFCFVAGEFLSYWPWNLEEGSRFALVCWHLLWQLCGSFIVYETKSKYTPSIASELRKQFYEN